MLDPLQEVSFKAGSIKAGLSTRLMVLVNKYIRDYLGDVGVSGAVDYIDGCVHVILSRGGSNRGWHDKATGLFRYQISSYNKLSSVPHFTSTRPAKVYTAEEGKVILVMPKNLVAPQVYKKDIKTTKAGQATPKSWVPTSVMGQALHNTSLAEAIKAVNQFKAELGDALMLEVTSEGQLRALVEYR